MCLPASQPQYIPPTVYGHHWSSCHFYIPSPKSLWDESLWICDILKNQTYFLHCENILAAYTF